MRKREYRLLNNAFLRASLVSPHLKKTRTHGSVLRLGYNSPNFPMRVARASQLCYAGSTVQIHCSVDVGEVITGDSGMRQDVSMRSLKTRVAQNTALLEQLARV